MIFKRLKTFVLSALTALAMTSPAFAGQLTLQDNGLLPRVDESLLETASRKWSFDAVVMIYYAPSKADLQDHVTRAAHGNTLAIGIDPMHHFTFVRYGNGTGIPSSEADVIWRQGNVYFKNGAFAEGAIAIANYAQGTIADVAEQAARAPTKPTVRFGTDYPPSKPTYVAPVQEVYIPPRSTAPDPAPLGQTITPNAQPSSGPSGWMIFFSLVFLGIVVYILYKVWIAKPARSTAFDSPDPIVTPPMTTNPSRQLSAGQAARAEIREVHHYHNNQSSGTDPLVAGMLGYELGKDAQRDRDAAYRVIDRREDPAPAPAPSSGGGGFWSSVSDAIDSVIPDSSGSGGSYDSYRGGSGSSDSGSSGGGGSWGSSDDSGSSGGGSWDSGGSDSGSSGGGGDW